MNIRDITRRVFKHNNVNFDSLAFKAFWKLGYSLVAVEEEDYRVADLLGDSFNPEVNNDIPAEQLKKEERREKARIKREKVWGCGLAKDGKPIWESFIWGFIGDDFIGSSYDVEYIAMLESRPVDTQR